MNIFDVIREPKLTEKTLSLKEETNQFAFAVNPKANKIQIKESIEKSFKVSVIKVRTMNVRGDKKRLNVKLVVSHGGLSVGADGGSHQQLEDIAIMRAIPNMRVLIPADSTSVSKLTWIIAQQYGPFYMRMARSKVPIIYDESQNFEIGKGITIRDGSDCTIVGCGITVKIALDAADQLKQEGISCRVIDCFTVKPIDKEILEKAARETGGIVTCEEHNILAGLGSAVSEVVSESYPVPIKRIGAQDMFGESARDNEIQSLFEKHGITSVNIANMVKDIRSKK